MVITWKWTFLEVASLVVTWWIVFFLSIVMYFKNPVPRKVTGQRNVGIKPSNGGKFGLLI